jgi:hypothetical protein
MIKLFGDLYPAGEAERERRRECPPTRRRSFHLASASRPRRSPFDSDRRSFQEPRPRTRWAGAECSAQRRSRFIISAIGPRVLRLGHAHTQSRISWGGEEDNVGTATKAALSCGRHWITPRKRPCRQPWLVLRRQHRPPLPDVSETHYGCRVGGVPVIERRPVAARRGRRRREICYTIESCPETSKHGLSLTTERLALTVSSWAVSLMRPMADPGR